MDDFDDAVAMAPFDLKAEAAVLSSVLLASESMSDVGDFLEPKHFYSEAHRRIFEAAVSLFARGARFDTVAISSWLSDAGRLAQVGGTAYVTEVINAAPAVTNVRSYAERVHSLWRLREMQTRARRVLAESYVSGDDVQAFCERSARSLHEIAYAPGAGDGLAPMARALDDAIAILKEAERQGRTLVGLPMGIDRLDRVLGGIQDGDLTILAARPGKGKSALGLQAAMNIAALGHVAAVFSLEMPRKQLAMRAACSEARVDVAKARTAMLTPSDWNKLTTASRFISNLPLHLDDTSGITCLAIRARLRRLQMESPNNRVRLAVVDYLQLVHGSAAAKRQGREREVAEVAQELKEIAKEFSLHVLACCQMNRDVENSTRRPRLRDLRESGAIEQAADNVIFLHEPPKEPDIVEIIVEKQRNGPTDVVSARFDRRYTRFDNLAEGEYDERENVA
jgi:replicative DNA helicase